MAKAINEAGSRDHTADLRPAVAPAWEPFAETVLADGLAVSRGTDLGHIAPTLRPSVFPVADLTLDPRNARQHDARNIAAVAASLQAHGQQKSIVAKRTYRGLSNVVLAGNAAVLAVLAVLRWSHLAVSWFEGTDDEAQDYALRDNRCGDLSHFDNQLLAALASEGVDLLALGWRADELGDLLALADADVVPTFKAEQPVGRLDRLEPHCATCRCREVKP
jgi:hypothetical protein